MAVTSHCLRITSETCLCSKESDPTGRGISTLGRFRSVDEFSLRLACCRSSRTLATDPRGSRII